MDTQEQLKLVTKELEDKTFQRNLLYNVENELNSLKDIKSLKEEIEIKENEYNFLLDIYNNELEEKYKVKDEKK